MRTALLVTQQNGGSRSALHGLSELCVTGPQAGLRVSNGFFPRYRARQLAYNSISIDKYRPVSRKRGNGITSFDKLSAVVKEYPTLANRKGLTTNQDKILSARNAESRHRFSCQLLGFFKRGHYSFVLSKRKASYPSRVAAVPVWPSRKRTVPF